MHEVRLRTIRSNPRTCITRRTGPPTASSRRTYGLDGAITAYDWDFGDGTTGSGTIVSREFVDIGNYTVTLTVTDDAGSTATATQTVTTTGPVPNQAPLASFTATPSSGNVPLFVAFDAAGSTDSDGTIDNYDWTFDDGATATGVSVNHEFVDPGTYAVTLTVTDNEGETGMVTSLVAAGVAAPIVDVRVSAGDDDAEESQSGSMSRSSSDLELADE
ncbi:MAG: PKD domain-containing protein, partial [Verrucomicrobiota bacterium]|nr:PKD domain-containing protein [Verrucomicrobiota bacterium]